MTFIVGLTGGIGSGKSTVANLLAERGARVVDTDVIAHSLTAPQGAAMAAIVATFGESMRRADGGLDRAAMRDLVFSDPVAKAKLEAIIHPLIRQYSEAACAVQGREPYVLLVVPLLLEFPGNYQHADRILVVDCDEAIQIRRVMARNNFSAELARAIIATQASRAQRQAAADDLVLNNGDLADLLPQVDLLHQRYLALSTAKTRVGG